MDINLNTEVAENNTFIDLPYLNHQQRRLGSEENYVEEAIEEISTSEEEDEEEDMLENEQLHDNQRKRNQNSDQGRYQSVSYQNEDDENNNFKRAKTSKPGIFEEAFLTLQNVLKCSVCHEVPRSVPVHRCQHGHIICHTCRPKLVKNDCPQCQVPLANERCLVSENLITDIPHRCKFFDGGCNIILKMKSLQPHEKMCTFRTVKCPYVRCKLVIHVSQLVQHLNSLHGLVSLEPNVLSYRSYWPIVDQDFGKTCDWKSAHFSDKDSDFFLIFTSKGGLWYAWVYVLCKGGHSKEEGEYYKFTVRSLENEKKEIIAKCISIEEHPIESILGGNVDCAVFTNANIKSFLRCDGVRYKVEIGRQKSMKTKHKRGNDPLNYDSYASHDAASNI